MPKKTIAELQSELDEQRKLTLQIMEQRDKLLTDATKRVEDTEMYQKMLSELELENKLAKYAQESYRQQEILINNLRAENRFLHEENRRLRPDYNVGETFTQPEKENYVLTKKCSKLEATIKSQEMAIKYLKKLLQQAGTGNTANDEQFSEQTTLHNPKRGRPPVIDERTRQRIIDLRKQKLSIRTIAAAEGVSIGTVAAIVKN